MEDNTIPSYLAHLYNPPTKVVKKAAHPGTSKAFAESLIDFGDGTWPLHDADIKWPPVYLHPNGPALIDTNRHITLLIGAPGTGKSTLAHTLRKALPLDVWSKNCAFPAHDLLMDLMYRADCQIEFFTNDRMVISTLEYSDPVSWVQERGGVKIANEVSALIDDVYMFTEREKHTENEKHSHMRFSSHTAYVEYLNEMLD